MQKIWHLVQVQFLIACLVWIKIVFFKTLIAFLMLLSVIWTTVDTDKFNNFTDVDGWEFNHSSESFKENVISHWCKAPSRMGTWKVYYGYNTKSSSTGKVIFWVANASYGKRKFFSELNTLPYSSNLFVWLLLLLFFLMLNGCSIFYYMKARYEVFLI